MPSRPAKLPTPPPGTITAFCSVGDTPLLLDHWLDHYARLGVDRMCIGVMGSKEFEGDIQERCKGYPAETFYLGDIFRHPHHGEDVAKRLMLRGIGLEPWDWVIWADVDEFRTFPVSLKEVVQACIERNIHAVNSKLVDRVAENGKMTEVAASPSIGEQYPMACDMTTKIMKANPYKIALHRAWVKCVIGHHHLSCNARVAYPIGPHAFYITHHFKWTKLLPYRLKRRLVDRKGAFPDDCYLDECQRCIDFLGPEERVDFTKIAAHHAGALTYPDAPRSRFP